MTAKDNEDQLTTLEIPANEVQPDPVLVAPVEAKASEKVDKVEKKPVVKDTRADEVRQAQDALKREQAERARIQQELTTERARADAEKGRATKLEADVHKRTGQALYSHGQATYSEQQQIINALHAVKMENDAAKRDLQIALTDDNLDPNQRAVKISEAQERIALAAADLRTLEHGKTQIEAKLLEAKRAFEAHSAQTQREEPKPEPKPEKAEPAADPFETYVSQFPKDSQDWLRAHPEFVKEPKLNKRLQAAALEWDAQDKQLHTADFIAHLDEKFFPKAKEEPVTEDDGKAEPVDVEIEPAAPAKSPAKSAPAAPVSRSAVPAASSDRKNLRVSLTSSEIKHALDMFGPGTKRNLDRDGAMRLYGKYKLTAEAEGRYQPR